MSFNFRKDLVEQAYALDKNYYYNLYITERKSTRDIAKILNISQPIVRKILKEKEIPLRTYKDNPTPLKKGDKMPEDWRSSISNALKGKIQPHLINKETGRGIRYSSVVVDCAFCKSKLERRQFLIKNHKIHFCNHECHGKWKSQNLTGKNNPTYTSKEVPCTECNKIIIRKECELKNNKNIFCSRDCHDLWRSKNQVGSKLYNWKGGVDNYYGESWAAAKKLARIRDNYTCQNCGKTKAEAKRNPDVHHIKPFKLFGEENHIEANQLSNLICYCVKCHKIKEEEHNKLIRESLIPAI